MEDLFIESSSVIRKRKIRMHIKSIKDKTASIINPFLSLTGKVLAVVDLHETNLGYKKPFVFISAKNFEIIKNTAPESDENWNAYNAIHNELVTKYNENKRYDSYIWEVSLNNSSWSSEL